MKKILKWCAVLVIGTVLALLWILGVSFLAFLAGGVDDTASSAKVFLLFWPLWLVVTVLLIALAVEMKSKAETTVPRSWRRNTWIAVLVLQGFYLAPIIANGLSFLARSMGAVGLANWIYSIRWFIQPVILSSLAFVALAFILCLLAFGLRRDKEQPA